MPSDIDNHGRPIWTPFANPSATSGQSHGVETVLRQNILNSEYYRRISKEEDFMLLVDEIYEQVDHAEPWMCGNARGASSGFCLLFRLAEMGLTDKQITHLVTHGDSPFIRVIGFLYIRYVVDGKELGKYLEKYYGDAEVFAPSPGGKEVTMGTFVRDLVLDQHYFETIFPRIPEVARRQLVARIKELGYSDKPLGCGGQGGSRKNDSGHGRPQSVKDSLSMRVGRRAPISDRDDGRRGGKHHHRGNDRYDRDSRRDRSRDRSRDRDRRRSRSRDRDRDRDRGDDRYRPYDRRDRYDRRDDDRYDRRYD